MTSPAWKVRAQGFLGTTEIAGPKHNPVILGFWKSAHLGFKDDETPWCMGFVNAMLEDSGIRGTRSGMAKSALTWGVKLTTPVDGCIVVFHRPPNPNSGHVGIFDGFVVRNGRRFVRTIGGNQGNKVSVALFPESQVAGYRWPKDVPVPVQREEIEDGEATGIEANVSMAALDEHSGGMIVDGPKPYDGGLPPVITRTLQVSTAVGTATTPFLAYATDWRVVLSVFAGITVIGLVGWFIYRRAGKE